MALVKFETVISDKTWVYFALDIANRQSFKLLRTFAPQFDILKQAGVVFDMYYSIYECQACRANNFSVPADDCLGGGRYCDFDPDNSGVATGRHLVEETIRQICLWRKD